MVISAARNASRSVTPTGEVNANARILSLVHNVRMWMTTKDPSSPYHLRQLSNAPTSNNGPNELPCNGTELRPILDQDRQNYVTDVESDDRIGRDGSSSISERSGLESRLVHRAEENTGGESQGEESHERRVWEKLRRYLVVCLLVLLITFSAAAYSLVGPFIPIEVNSYRCSTEMHGSFMQ